MNEAITVDTREVDQWVNNIINDSEFKRNFLTRVGVQGQRRLKDEAHKISATNELAQSINMQVEEDSVSIFSLKEYADIALEYGRKAGRFPPIGPIVQWAKKRSIDPRYAFPIARKIAMKGTRKSQMNGPKQVTAAAQGMLWIVGNNLKYFLEKYS